MKSVKLTLAGVCGAISLMSTFVTPAAASPNPDEIRYTATYTPMYDSSQQGVSSSRSDSAISGGRIAAGGGRGDFNYHDVTYKECVKHGNSAGKAEWVKNHFALCRRGTVQVVGVTDENIPVGTLTYVETIIGYGYQGTRAVSFDQLFENITATGTLKDGTTFLVNRWNQSNASGAVLHAGQKHGGVTQISPGFRGEVGAKNEDPSLNSWKKSSMEHLTFEDDGVGTGKDKTHFFSFVPATFFIAKGSKNIQLEEPRVSVRFDGAPYLAYKKGSVFTNVRAAMDYDRKDPKTRETASHIYDAQHTPGLTVPKKAGKSIPGASTSSPLHRIYYDTKKRKANRATAIAACLKEWPEYAKQGKDCDEYPFSTTAEGASAAKGNFSARALTSKDNQKAGSMLSTWFSDDRILDGDAFYVKVK
ncbi:NucA/NucB deoxyribonuclease domain-containing protein [Streptomyces sp. WAC01526]|uniref:NucA/NucB deoxyribonuclease domain-containing protein n=1 Tax=Streptomyces sp. WAC01526 TaxID=2588709 RepID=UPI0011DFDADF|nr:NucA/NucB deoxyribonuclease domain-containing protein [Streptomyces sp. WAC01526]